MKISHLKEKLILTAAYLAYAFLWRYFGLPCLFELAFGIPCPGCGMTRAALALLQLDFAAAFSYHPMIFAMPILYLYFLSDNGLFHKKLPDRLVLIAIGLGFLLQWGFKLFL